MNENLNLVEILKDCPKGTKLYSTVYGEVELEELYQDKDTLYPIRVKLRDNALDDFSKEGRLDVDYSGECMLFPSREQRDWSQFKPKQPKFDPNTLKPFDKVLARDSDEFRWKCAFYSHQRNDCSYKFVTTDSFYEYCIPYNDDTKHLVGTTEEAPEYYRYWEE